MFLFLFCMSVLTPVSIAVVGMVLQKHPVRDINGYCSHATIPRGVSAHFVRKSRVFQREIASFCDFCASRSVLLVTE